MTQRPVPIYEFYPPRIRDLPRSEREPAAIPPFKVKHPNRRRKQTKSQNKLAASLIEIDLMPLSVLATLAAFSWFLVLAGF